MSIKLKLTTAKSLALQAIYKNGTSWPFLSGDSFAKLADVSFYSNQGQPPNLKDIASASVAFCPSHKVTEMLDDYGKHLRPSVLILGNSDEDFLDRPLGLPNSVKTIFAQNLIRPVAGVRILPIGLENLRLGRNGLPHLFRPSEANPKTEEILIGPFGMTHLERKFPPGLQESSPGLWRVLDGQLTPNAYARRARNYLYVAAPRGNGMDTHRFWETLYRGSYPIVRRSEWSKALRDLGFPLIEISEWNEDELSSISSRTNFHTKFEPKSLDQLWMPYWQKQIGRCV